MLFDSRIDPNPYKCVWVKCIVCWLMGPVIPWARYLFTMENPCIQVPESSGEMLKWLYQTILEKAFPVAKRETLTPELPPLAERKAPAPEYSKVKDSSGTRFRVTVAG